MRRAVQKLLEPFWPVQASNGIVLPFYALCTIPLGFTDVSAGSQLSAPAAFTAGKSTPGKRFR